MNIEKRIFCCLLLVLSRLIIFAQKPAFVCMIKIDNSLYDGVSKIDLVKGKKYYFYLAGKHTNYVSEIKSADPGLTIKKTFAFGLTVSECGTYLEFEISVGESAKAKKNLQISFSGTVPLSNEPVSFNLPVTIVERPTIKTVLFLEDGRSVVRPVSGKAYDMKLSGTNLSYLELLDKEGMTYTRQRSTDTTLSCKVIFNYRQQNTLRDLTANVLPLYGAFGAGRYDKSEKIAVPSFVVLPLPTIFNGNNIDWTWGPFYGEKGTYFADVTGDGKADAIAINNTGVYVRRSNGSDFQPNELWYNGLLFSTMGTYFTDVTGDGKADAIMVGQTGVYVYRSNGNNGFGNMERWTAAFSGTKGTYIADVTGDGKADAIAVTNFNIVVRPSNGSSFGEEQIWTTGAFFGERMTAFGDVDGDGKADVIAVNNYGIVVKKSVGSRFGPNEAFTANAYYGTRATFFADVTGDRKADAIVINDDRVTVRRSTGTAFLDNEDGTSQAFYAQRVNALADIYGDGKAAIIVVNNETVYVRRAN